MRIEPRRRPGGTVFSQESLDIAFGLDYTQTITGLFRVACSRLLWVWGSGNRCIKTFHGGNMRSVSALIAVVFLSLSLMLPGQVAAQSATAGAIIGTVTDPQAAAIAGAKVE